MATLVTLVKRKSRYTIIIKRYRKTAELVRQAIIDKLEPLLCLVKKITFNHGKEFADHALIDQALNSTPYFAQPYANWHRGSNENYNSLLRQYIPKKRKLSIVTD